MDTTELKKREAWHWQYLRDNQHRFTEEEEQFHMNRINEIRYEIDMMETYNMENIYENE